MAKSRKPAKLIENHDIHKTYGVLSDKPPTKKAKKAIMQCINKVGEVYGAKIEKPMPVPDSLSAASVRSRGKLCKPETPKPDKKYDIGNTVYIPKGIVPFTNGLIVGIEWGGDNKAIQDDVWTYYVRDVGSHCGAEMFLIREDIISGLISM